MKLADYVITFLEEHGINDIFLLSGGGCMHLLDAIGKSNMNYTCNLHEQGVSIAADAYGQYTNHIGVGLVTTGPGGTNAITGIAAAWLDSTPLLMLSGQVKRTDMVKDRKVRQMGFQEIDITSIVSPITKYAITITDPNSIKYHLQKAYYLAINQRPGPVWIDIPLDVQAIDIDPDTLPEFMPEHLNLETKTLSKKILQTIELLNKATRPIILVGNGVRLSNGIDAFMSVINMLQIPVLTTWKSIDFLSEDHPLYVGRPGLVGQRGANFSLQNSDLLISIGARLDYGQIGFIHENLARSAKKVMIDIDDNEIKKMQCHIDISMCADAKKWLITLLENKSLIKEKDRKKWLLHCKNWQKKYPVVLKKYWQEKKVNNYVLIEVLSKAMKNNDLLIPGSSGACSEVTMQAFKVKQGQRIFNSEGLGPMGFGIAASIGGCIASGKKRTICIDGDGGFYMNIQELELAAQLKLPIKFFILNNQGYASIRTTQNNYFNGNLVASSEKSGVTLPNTKKIASAFNIPYMAINNHDHIIEIVQTVLDTKNTVICEVFLDFHHTTAPKVTSSQCKDGSFKSNPLEDMSPLLSRKEFESEMLINIKND